MNEFLMAVWQIVADLAPALLLGLLIAGAIHEFVPRHFIRRRLSGSRFRNVLDAVLIGVPMPLCSCGVVPTAISLKNDGASKGAATGFLISTPQTGVDSILVSASFLGWPFAIFKVAAAFVTGLIGGVIVNAGEKAEAAPVMVGEDDDGPRRSFLRRVGEAIHYAVFDLLASIDLWLIAGIAAAALITIFIPTGYLSQVSWTQGLGGMLLALAISLPLYVCTTSSVPIAASLIAAGMPLGTALVFLMAGPATNAATLGMVYRGLGKRVVIVYVGVVAVMSIVFGLTFDWVLGGVAGDVMQHQHEGGWLTILSSLLLIALLAFFVIRRIWAKLFAAQPDEAATDGTAMTVLGMTCMGCVDRVKKAAESVHGVSEAIVELDAGRVVIRGDRPDAEAVVREITKAGYKVQT
ncbi:MAG: permease [Candidatus Lernaella stagnicola]|nr:permease [Candidatus Lernaella stagnicola]